MGASDKYDFDFGGKTVLVVEDTLMSFKLIAAVFSRVNLRVLHATDGYHAIELCEGDQDFDLVLMDIQMPGLNGIDATREILKLRPGLPVIAATANTFDDEEEACMKAGAAGYMTKPLKFRKLFLMMQQLFAA